MKNQHHSSAGNGWLIGVAVWVAVSTLALAHGELHEQIDAVSKEITSRPREARLYLKRAELRRLHREEEGAARDYDAAERFEPGMAEVHLGRGKLLFEFGKLKEARAALDRFLEAKPDHADALLTRARVEVKRGQPLAAAADYSKVLELSPKAEPEHYLEYAKTLVSAGPEHVPAALAVLDQGIDKLGELPTFVLFANDLDVERGNFEAALTRIDRLAASSKRKEAWLERKGDILRQTGRLEEAKATYEAAIDALTRLSPQVRSRRAVAELESRLRTKTLRTKSE